MASSQSAPAAAAGAGPPCPGQEKNMIKPELSFHEAIRSGDSAARLIYADRLEEHGRDEEAALLRSGRWCLIPAGSFWMGGGGGKAGDIHIPIQHHYYLGAYTVTQAEWQAVMG